LGQSASCRWKETHVKRLQIRNFYAWYNEFFAPSVHHHHDVEERIFIPWMKTKAEIPDKVTADHKELLVALDGIQNLEKDFKEAAQAKNSDAFRAHTNNLRNRVK